MAFPNDTYATYDIFNLTPVRRGDMSIDNNFTLVGDDIDPRYKYSFKNENDISTNDYIITTMAAFNDLYTFFRDKKGQYTPFWLPSYREDFKVYETFGAGATNIKVEKHNLVTELGNFTRHIYINSSGDSAKISSFVESADYITLTIDTSTTAGLSAEDTFYILYFARFYEDELGIDLVSPSDTMTTTIMFKELQEETP